MQQFSQSANVVRFSTALILDISQISSDVFVIFHEHFTLVFEWKQTLPLEKGYFLVEKGQKKTAKAIEKTRFFESKTAPNPEKHRV